MSDTSTAQGNLANIGVVGLAVMGSNIARNFASHGYTVAVYSKEIYRGKKVLSCEGMPYHAKCVVIHEKDGHKQLTVLKA